MNWKLLLLLIILAGAAVWGVVQIQHRPAPATQAVKTEKLFPGLEDQVNEVTGLRIVKAGDTTVAEVQRADGDWVVTNKYDYPADLGTLRGLLLGLANAEIIEHKTANPELYDRIGVQDIGAEGATGTLVTVEAPDSPLSLIIGDTASSGSRQTYVRRPDDPQSLLVSGDLAPAQDVKQWLRQPILDIPAEQVQQVKIRHPDGDTLTLSRPDRETTNLQPDALPDGRELSYATVANPIGSALSSLRLEDVMPAGQLDPAKREPVVEAEYLTFDGLRVKATVFKVDGQRYLALAADFDPDQYERFTMPEQTGETTSSETAAANSQAGNDNAPGDTPDNPDQEEKPPKADTVAADAAALNLRLQQWVYVVTDYKYDNLGKRLADLLKPLEKTDEVPGGPSATEPDATTPPPQGEPTPADP